MPIGPARMPLFDHLGELRMRLVRIVACLAVAVCIFYFAAPAMGQFLLLPITPYIPVDVDTGWAEMMALDPFEAFAVRFQIALFFGVVATSPVILWQILAFFLPALKPKERKWFMPTFVIAVVLFILGTVFCYTIILNAAFQWLTEQAQGLGYVAPRMSSYIDIIIKFEIAFGIAFELPLIIFYLVIFDVIPYKKLRSSWRIVYVSLMILCAMVTPDASPVTMLLMFAAMVALYEVSLLLARIVLAKRIKQQNEELAAEEDE
ncbi:MULTISPECIES: twin-arginine translocase subunit TatC [unclassified Adlercreutzia]|uniref:twin-arginine translocase subunit TatC n=1 Tax=unclassified Adlercreutzia TaxID=2636013 RepID=UPI0013EAFF4B|nr:MULTISPECIES: twin-arginine translocase subunit TatC [unclassified Adlercreutzia]